MHMAAAHSARRHPLPRAPPTPMGWHPAHAKRAIGWKSTTRVPPASIIANAGIASWARRPLNISASCGRGARAQVGGWGASAEAIVAGRRGRGRGASDHCLQFIAVGHPQIRRNAERVEAVVAGDAVGRILVEPQSSAHATRHLRDFKGRAEHHGQQERGHNLRQIETTDDNRG